MEQASPSADVLGGNLSLQAPSSEGASARGPFACYPLDSRTRSTKLGVEAGDGPWQGLGFLECMGAQP